LVGSHSGSVARKIVLRAAGVAFRRQVPVAGLFIADLLAPSIKLIVEVDGTIHATRAGR
jgi:very-short-patch-repair endonuclease